MNKMNKTDRVYYNPSAMQNSEDESTKSADADSDEAESDSSHDDVIGEADLNFILLKIHKSICGKSVLTFNKFKSMLASMDGMDEDDEDDDDEDEDEDGNNGTNNEAFSEHQLDIIQNLIKAAIRTEMGLTFGTLKNICSEFN